LEVLARYSLEIMGFSTSDFSGASQRVWGDGDCTTEQKIPNPRSLNPCIPQTTNHEALAMNPQPSTLNPPPSTLNPQPSTLVEDDPVDLWLEHGSSMKHQTLKPLNRTLQYKKNLPQAADEDDFMRNRMKLESPKFQTSTRRR